MLRKLSIRTVSLSCSRPHFQPFIDWHHAIAQLSRAAGLASPRCLFISRTNMRGFRDVRLTKPVDGAGHVAVGGVQVEHRRIGCHQLQQPCLRRHDSAQRRQ